MRASLVLGAVVLLTAAGAAATACGHRTQTFDSHVRVTAYDVIRRDPQGNPLTADLEVEWTDCPGEQREVARVDGAFARCFAAHHPGETLPVRVRWADDGAQLDWDIVKVAECDRADDDDDDVSFDMVHECRDVKEQGQAIGFHCDRRPSQQLLKACPWFQRH